METLKYTTQIKGKKLDIPEHILERIDRGSEIEVTFRQVRHPSGVDRDVAQVIDEIERQMNKEFPN